MRKGRFLAAGLTAALLLIPSVGHTADAAGLSPLQIAVACAPPPAAAMPLADSLRVAGSTDTIPRSVFGRGDQVVINGGAGRGLAIDQVYFVRRPVHFGSAMGVLGMHARPTHTAGWIRVVAVNDSTAIATVEHMCGSIEQGDYLEPFAVPALPAGLDRSDTSGAPRFATSGHVLFGDLEKITGGSGDYMVVDLGAAHGLAAGARLAVYRDLGVSSPRTAYQAVSMLPLAPIGEATVVSAQGDLALVRITAARDAVRGGDVIVPRQ